MPEVTEETQDPIVAEFGDTGLKLEAKTPAEEKILEYLEANASQELRTKINAGEKTMKGCYKHVEDKARNLKAGGSCVMVEDTKVYGWAVHFFEDDEIKEPKQPPKPKPYNSKKADAAKKKAEKEAKAKADAEAKKKLEEEAAQDLFGAKAIEKQRKRPF